jgi:hypothetical protein
MVEFKRTFIITSVIFFSKKKVVGSNTRSVFTPEERMKQTAQTISSIRAKAPGSFIILLEMGNEKNIGHELINGADKYIFIGKHPFVRWAVNGKLKGLGEAAGLIVSRKELLTGADFYCKMSGRYFLNDHFNIDDWKGNFFLAKKYERGISTRLYGFDKMFFTRWQKALKKSLLKLCLGHSIEDVLPVKFGCERIHPLTTLGLSGYIAPDGSYLEE